MITYYKLCIEGISLSIYNSGCQSNVNQIMLVDKCWLNFVSSRYVEPGVGQHGRETSATKKKLLESEICRVILEYKSLVDAK